MKWLNGSILRINDVSLYGINGPALSKISQLEFPDGVKLGRDWYCAGDAKGEYFDIDTLSCENKIVDCGAADASGFIDSNNSNRIRPKTSDGLYHASFDFSSGVPTDMRCINTTTLINGSETYDPSGVRGAFTWSCGGDSDGNTGDSVVQCSARKDCGWAGPEQTGYATVYYNENTARNK
jgi:hypothetical protein